MWNLFRIILVPLVVGIIGFVAHQVITRFIIEPIHEQSKLIGEIAESLVFYADLYYNPGIGSFEEMAEASKVLRRQASRLRATTDTIRYYTVWQSRGIVPSQANVIEASKNLIGLSNCIHQGDPKHNHIRQERIKELLRIKTNV